MPLFGIAAYEAFAFLNSAATTGAFQSLRRHRFDEYSNAHLRTLDRSRLLRTGSFLSTSRKSDIMTGSGFGEHLNVPCHKP